MKAISKRVLLKQLVSSDEYTDSQIKNCNKKEKPKNRKCCI